MIINVIIPLGANGHVDQRVARQLIQHVIKEAHTGLVVILTCPVEVQLDRDCGFSGFASDRSAPHGMSFYYLRPL